MKKRFIKIVLFSLSILIIYSTKSYAVEDGTVRMKINGETGWTNINISESYKECEDLNSATSTLGTTALEAHLTTDADWSAMALFSVSQYGGATSNNPQKTNGNNSGIYDVGKYYVQTTGISVLANKKTLNYISGLFNNDGTLKKYVREWPEKKEDTNFVSFIDTFGWLGANSNYMTHEIYPISLKKGLFEICGGYSVATDHGSSGGPFGGTSFRPVIWN